MFTMQGSPHPGTATLGISHLPWLEFLLNLLQGRALACLSTAHSDPPKCPEASG